MLLTLISYCWSQADSSTPYILTDNVIKRFTKDVLKNYSEMNNVEFDRTKYSTEEKDKILYTSYFENNYEKIETLVFFDEDKKLKNLHLWVDALYRLQAYSLISHFFKDVLPQNETVLLSLYKLNDFEAFLNYSDSVEKPSRRLKYHIVKAKFYSKRFTQVASIDAPVIRNEMTRTISLLKFRSLFYLQRFNEAISFAKLFNSNILEGSPNDYLRLAICYLSTDQLDIAEMLFRKFEKFYRDKELLNLQKALFYQGIIYTERDEFDKATVFYNEVLDISKTSQLARGVHKNYAIHFQESNNFSKAIEHWEKYLSLLPDTDKSRMTETQKIITQLREKLFLHPTKFQ